MLEVQKSLYIAENSVSFENKEDCIKYELFINTDLQKIEDKFNKFLSKKKNYWQERLENLIVSEISISEDFKVLITLKNAYGTEPYEDLNLLDEKYDEKIKKLEKKYRCSISIPSKYWGK